MENTIGKRIAALRREKGLKQEDLAKSLDVSSQAVSKWENDQSCPDISLLPKLAKLLGVSVDVLLSGEEEKTETVLVPEAERKDIRDMMFRVVIDSADGDKVRISVPVALIQVAADTGMNMFEMSGNSAMKNIDWAQVLSLVQKGVMGDLLMIEDRSGDTVRIFVE
ncbi:MAG: helix-turn-helix domain-containing protein [Ruminococcaceae bacterium]|nr:helix-turn-helix domain-containing protein [Oscillospiraceae bacterium]